MEITYFLNSLWQLSVSMAPYILFGLIFAGILHELIPDTVVTKHLGDSNILSVIKATLFGTPLPICSCGVIPLASSINKSGASKGATLSFLISTPITGVDSIMVTYGIFGWLFTLYRIISSVIIAIAAGILTNIFDKKVITKESALADVQSCCNQSGCCENKIIKKRFSIINALKYAFIILLSDIAKPLFFGLILGAIIASIIPDSLEEILKSHYWLSYVIAILIGIPMYVCATASLPIAAALMLSGVSAGATFAFLTAGPATNTITITVVKKMLGNRSLFIYLGSIVIGSLLFGLGMDYIFDIYDINPVTLVHLDDDAGIIDIFSAILLWSFILYFIVAPYFIKKSNGKCCN